MELNEIIAENLKRLRMERGLSLGRLAELSGVSKVMLSQVEKGESSPTINTLWKIATGLQVPYTQLIDIQATKPFFVPKAESALVDGGKGYRVYHYNRAEGSRDFEFFNSELDTGASFTSEGHGTHTRESVLVTAGAGAGVGDSGICHGRRGFYTVRFLPPPYVHQSGRGHDCIYQYCLLRRIREEKDMFWVGCHLSASKGYLAMGKMAEKIGANTFQFFTRNPRGSRAKEIDPEDVRKFLEYAQEHDICQILAHAPYTLNPCSKDAKTREFAWMTMEDDLKRMEYVPGNCYNFHPGSHVGQGAQEGIRMISEMLNQILKEEQHTTVLLETMAGKGTEVGRSFEELAQILDRVELKNHMGVCLDTCHVYDAGYDLVGQLDQVLEEFDRMIGLERLKAIHMNDSKNPFASHKDRHEKIGEGSIGLEAFERMVNHPKLQGIPIYLETPNELEGYAREIRVLREMKR